jgi:MFS family permease
MTDHRDEEELRGRRRALLTALAGTAIGALLIAGFESAWPAIERWVWAADQPLERIALLLVALAVLLCLPIVVLAACLWRLDSARRLPRLGRGTRWVAAILMILIGAFALFFWRLSGILLADLT